MTRGPESCRGHFAGRREQTDPFCPILFPMLGARRNDRGYVTGEPLFAFS